MIEQIRTGYSIIYKYASLCLNNNVSPIRHASTYTAVVIYTGVELQNKSKTIQNSKF